MLKLQVQLIPPSALNPQFQYDQNRYPINSSQFIANASGISLNNINSNRQDTSLSFPTLSRTLSTSSLSRSNRNIKKLLHFTKPGNDLQQLCNEIVEKVDKMYHDLDINIEIESLQDKNGCDLDPDFIVRDVFNVDNIVRVIISNDIDWNEYVPVSGYNDFKRRRLNGETTRQAIPAIVTTSAPFIGLPEHGEIQTSKRYTSASSTLKPLYKGVRVSTPLIHQIHSISSRNSEENLNDIRDRSFLPPPAQPQSPPIRISSGVDQGTIIKGLVEDDTVSRSETVDPDKSKQQRLAVDSLKIPMTTPNRVNLTGQNVLNGENYDNMSFVQQNISSVRRHQSLVTPRISSQNFGAPHRRLSDVQKQFTDIQSSVLQNQNNGFKKMSTQTHYSPHPTVNQDPNVNNAHIDDIMASTYEKETIPQKQIETIKNMKSPLRTLKRQKSSIADNNGSPVKNSPPSDEISDQVHLAALPEHKKTIEQFAKDKNQEAENLVTSEPKIFSSSETYQVDENAIESSDSDMSEMDETLQNCNPEEVAEADSGLGLLDQNEIKERGDDYNTSKTQDVENNGEVKDASNSSFRKNELLDAMDGEDFHLPDWLRANASKPGRRYAGKNKKPYTTVLHKDIDNSKPDPRNILPKRTPRNAARKATQKLTGIPDPDVDSESSGSNNEPLSFSEDSSDTGVETDYSSDDDELIHPLSPTDEVAEQIERIKLKESIVPEKDVPKAGEKEIQATSKERKSSISDISSVEISDNETQFTIASSSFSRNASDINTLSKNDTVGEFGSLESLPQSTQRVTQHEINITPIQIPVSRMLELSSPVLNKTNTQVSKEYRPESPSMLHDYTPRVRPSLNSIGNLKNKNISEISEANDDENSSISDISSSSSEESSDDDSDMDFSNARNANAALTQRKN